ncbi:manganese transport protein MntH [Methylacidiphilum kamchatkense Kam1]|uniref:Divalent metal cation transporter MntH n=1 Tax=Methylacidiphilum kamchatkense Kam1 TaxID=1202785 RepID=A0A0C1RTN2_9BACT|nr:Nramp family divalent metal transporter [Methylacidiphilum kamchatkense]KIE58326.1 manganese transport protein MntH [Methylacidiphilum kamchatkense Kam1]QDQ42272.1 manganese transport protein [Methylacidiphilum kamchatkense Kam1]
MKKTEREFQLKRSQIDSWVIQRAKEILEGKEPKIINRFFPFIGPAFIAAIAYIDPGNYATNIESGSKYGYTLLWVVCFSNLMAIFIQWLSAKVGMVTGKNLPEWIRDSIQSPFFRYFYWIQAEIMAIATDLAEFIGAAIGFKILFGFPLIWGACLTAITTSIILYLQKRGFRLMELIVGAFVGIVALCYLLELFIAHPDSGSILYGLFIPHFQSTESIYLAAGILGATVMPHAIYLHSALTQDRINTTDCLSKKKLLQYSLVDVFLAMGIAGGVNMAMLIVSAAIFHQGNIAPNGLEMAYQTLIPALGSFASTIFGLSLLASGISSSAVGTLAGQVIMQGFVHFTFPIWFRRLFTMLPAVFSILLGIDSTKLMIFSQVVLSFGIGFALIPLLLVNQNKAIMGVFSASPLVSIIGWAIALFVILLNIFLLVDSISKIF